MEILNFTAVIIMPLMIFLIIAHGLAHRVEVFSCFQAGAKDGAETVFRILPSLIAIFVAIGMFRASGALDIISRLISPVLSFLQFPCEVLPLAIMRPISGSASLGLVAEMIKTHGTSSTIGRIASVMMGSTETTFYTLAVYFGSVGIKNSRWTVKAALLADLAGILMSVYVVRLFFS